jgi:hypothetical protein
VDSHLVHAVFHCDEALRRRGAGGVHLVSQLLTSIFSWSSSASRAMKCKTMVVSIKAGLDWGAI